MINCNSRQLKTHLRMHVYVCTQCFLIAQPKVQGGLGLESKRMVVLCCHLGTRTTSKSRAAVCSCSSLSLGHGCATLVLRRRHVRSRMSATERHRCVVVVVRGDRSLLHLRRIYARRSVRHRHRRSLLLHHRHVRRRRSLRWSTRMRRTRLTHHRERLVAVEHGQLALHLAEAGAQGR